MSERCFPPPAGVSTASQRARYFAVAVIARLAAGRRSKWVVIAVWLLKLEEPDLQRVAADAVALCKPGKIPDIYRGADAKVSQFEMSLWNDFWKLYDDETYRHSRGIRALGGHGVWGPFLPERIYTLTIESDGGLNMTSEPLKGIYRAAMQQQHQTTTKPTVQ